MANLYDILGVDPKAKSTTLRNAYRKLARECHPDINPDPKAHEKMALINSAFETLNDPVRRQEYDQVLFGHAVSVITEQGVERTHENVSVRMFKRLKEHRTPIYSIAFDKETNCMISSSFDNQILWWDENYEVKRSLRLEGGVVNVVHPIQNDRIVAAGCSESLISTWHIQSGEVASWRNTPLEWICCVNIAPDGNRVALGSLHSTMQVCKSTTGEPVYSRSQHEESVTAVGWSPDGQLLASGSADATVKIWTAQTGRLLETLTNVRSTVTAIAFSADSRFLAIAAVDRSVRIFRLGDLELVKTFFGHEKPIENIAFHPSGHLLASVGRDGVVYLWNVLQGRGHGRIEASTQPLSAVAFSPDGSMLAAGGLDKILRLWQLEFN